MKRYLLVIELFFAICVYSQNSTIDGFWGFKFGESKDVIVNSIRKRFGGDIKIDERKGNLFISPAEFGEIVFGIAYLRFTDDKLYSGFFTKDTKDIDLAIYISRNIKRGLCGKYGEPKNSESDMLLRYTWGKDDRATVMLELRIGKDNMEYEVSLLYEDFRLRKNSIDDF
jgi:hypothetical protein